MARQINFVVVHCTRFDNATVDSIRSYHVHSRGYDDIGYHCVIHRDGSIHPGRPEANRGAHASNKARSATAIGALTRSLMTGGQNNGNAGSLGIVVCGNYQNILPTQAQINALVTQITLWCQTYGINPDHLFGHRDFDTPKTCPGQHLYARLPDIRAAVALRRGT